MKFKFKHGICLIKDKDEILEIICINNECVLGSNSEQIYDFLKSK